MGAGLNCGLAYTIALAVTQRRSSSSMRLVAQYKYYIFLPLQMMHRGSVPSSLNDQTTETSDAVKNAM